MRIKFKDVETDVECPKCGATVKAGVFEVTVSKEDSKITTSTEMYCTNENCDWNPIRHFDVTPDFKDGVHSAEVSVGS